MTETCPICGIPSVQRSENEFPFCSARCKRVDLHNWLSGTYQPPGSPSAIADEEESGAGE